MYIILFLVLASISYALILILKSEKIESFIGQKIKFISSISNYLVELEKRQILLKHIKMLTPVNIVIISVTLFVLSIILFNFAIGVLSTSIILSIPILVSPFIISKMLIKRNKHNILYSLPMYAVNLKNYISEDNNIIAAIMKTSVEPPLKIFIERFKGNVSRGVNVIEALDMLNREVDVKEFSDLIEGVKLCYINGGNFVSVLEKYISIITKEQTYKEESEEKAFSSILTLIIMIVLNIAVVLFILNNNEYSIIIRTTFMGKLILNINAISYMGIAVIMGKIYKEE